MFFVEEGYYYPGEFLNLCDKSAIYPIKNGKLKKALN